SWEQTERAESGLASAAGKVELEHQHIPHLDAVLEDRAAVVALVVGEVIAPDVVHPEAAALVEADIAEGGVAGADEHPPLAPPPRLIHQPRDQLPPVALPTPLRGDGELH